MSRPSEPILAWLRKQLDAKGENTASLAARLEVARPALRRMLSGRADLPLDLFIKLTESLGLSAEDMGMPSGAELPDIDEEGPAEPLSGEFGNQPRVLLETGFDHGVDFMFTVDTAALDDDWGGPEAALKQFAGRPMPIQLDAAYHQYNAPEFDDEGFSLTLSFDTLYRCRFPWHAVQQVIFRPLAPEAPEPEPEVEEEPVKGAPFLRVVK